MILTTQQLQTIKADILANPDLAAFLDGSDGANDMAAVYNLSSAVAPSTAMTVWRTDAKVTDIYDAINWSLYTPSDAIDTTVSQSNRLMAIQVKQMNLQNILQGRTTIDASKANIRAGLRDAVVAIPAGTGGAAVSPGGASGANVLTACTRTATRLEKLLNAGSATTGSTTAFLLGVEGKISGAEIQAARNS